MGNHPDRTAIPAYFGSVVRPVSTDNAAPWLNPPRTTKNQDVGVNGHKPGLNE